MGLLPLPSHVHYELLLQLLERQTLPSLESGSPSYFQVQSVIVNLRKALACQKQLEQNCHTLGLEVEYRWSLNHPRLAESVTPVASSAETTLEQP